MPDLILYPAEPAPEGVRGPRRPLRVGSPQLHAFSTSDGVDLRLTRHAGGTRGPVVLVHCIGVSSWMYALDTVETNLLEYLFEHGFDVWMLDYRLSTELPSGSRPASFDEVATRDFPAAIGRIREVTGAADVQVVAHGVGSQTFTMAMLAGLQGVRSAVCSQVAAHLRAPLMNRLKANLFSAGLLDRLNVDLLSVNPGPDDGWPEQILSGLMASHPVEEEEECDSPVCRRITAMYGPLYEHDRLNAETHDALPRLFGQANVRAFAHLIRNLRAGQIVDEAGENAYLPHLERLAIPIAFLHGEKNACLLPDSTRLTAAALGERNGEHLYAWHPIPGYGHVDCMFGKDAARDVYPLILEHLLATDS